MFLLGGLVVPDQHSKQIKNPASLTDSHELLHPAVVVGPVTDDLQTVGQVAVRVGEVGLQFQRRAVGLEYF